MSVFSSNFTLASIEGVSEDQIMIDVLGEKIEVDLTERNKKIIHEQVLEENFFVPYNLDTNEVMIEVYRDEIPEYFPEVDLKEFEDALDDIPEEHK